MQTRFSAYADLYQFQPNLGQETPDLQQDFLNVAVCESGGGVTKIFKIGENVFI